VIQNDIGNEYAATTIVAAITSTLKIYPVTVAIAKGQAGLKQASMVNLAQVLTIDKSRLRRRLGALPPDGLLQVDAAIRVSLNV
jgi:mRNA-degrading endonuclease toxin of MazEF toxin-antitoxin module